MEPENKSKLSLIISIVALVAVIGAGIWYFAVQKKGGNAGPTMEQLYPKPADVLHVLSGGVDDVSGAMIFIKVIDPNDYKPHPDSSARTTQLRAVTVLPSTLIQQTDNKTGTLSPASITDIRKGDAITVESDINIKDAKSFDAGKITLVR